MLPNALSLQLALVLLVLSGQARYARAQQVYTAEIVESWVFQQDRNADGARRRLDSHLTIHLDEIQHACKLTEEQRKRLLLAGHGDIKRFFDRFEALRRPFKPIRQDQPDFQQVYQELWQRISPLQTSLRDGLFEADSLFGKIVASTLTAEQKASYDALSNERHQFQFRNSVAKVIHALDQSARLTQAQRRQLTELLTKEIKAPKKSAPTTSIISSGNSAGFPRKDCAAYSMTCNAKRSMRSCNRPRTWPNRFAEISFGPAARRTKATINRSSPSRRFC